MIKVFAHQDRFSKRIDIVVVEEVNHERFLAMQLEFVKILDGACINQPTFSINQNEAQALIDELWQCGLRPSEGTGSAGALAATQKHLDDMRTLVFKK